MLLLKEMSEKKKHYIVGGRKDTRINNAPPDLFDPDELRLGRRESEPHSAEVTYLFDVLTTNFTEGRALWDLHHYFRGSTDRLKGEKIDIQFDVSFFKDWNHPQYLPSYNARDHGNRVPDLAINVLSKSTWNNDLSEKVDTCKDLGIPVYAVFSPYEVTTRIYHPPFLRVYLLQENGSYKQEDLKKFTLEEGGKIIEENTINLHNALPFSLGLMRRKQEYVGGQSLFRLILLDPSEMRIFPTKVEKVEEEKDKKLEEKDKEIEQLKTQLKMK